MSDGGSEIQQHTNATEKRRAVEGTAASAHPETYRGRSPIAVRKMGHLVYEVSDIERSIRFWTEVMGFTVTEGNDRGMVFLRYGADHHGIGLKPAGGKMQRPPSAAGLAIEHLAFEVESMDVLLKARAFMQENNIPIVFEGRKGAGCNTSINFLDPDGYEFEIYYRIDQIDESGRLRPKSQFRPASSLDEAIAHPVPERW